MPSTTRGAGLLRLLIPMALSSCGAVAEGSSPASETVHIEFTPVFTTRGEPSGRAAMRLALARSMTVGAELQLTRRPAVQQARLSIGNREERGWAIDVGRQRLSYGDERLLGGNGDAGLNVPGWDGGRVRFLRGRLSADVLSVFSPYYGAAARGVFISIRTGDGSLEPYVIQKRAGTSVTAAGVRALGTHGGSQYIIEVVSEGLRWAAHADLGHSTGASQAGIEWNFASREFDEFFPARFNQFHVEDPYGWTDTVNGALNYRRSFGERLTAAGSYRMYWSAGAQYRTAEVLVGIEYNGRGWSTRGGVGRLVARRAGDLPRWTPHVSLEYRF